MFYEIMFFKAACGRFGFLKIFHNPAGQKNFHLTLASRIRDFCLGTSRTLLKLSGMVAMGVVSIGFVGRGWDNFRSTNLKSPLKLAMGISVSVHVDCGLYPPCGSGSSIRKSCKIVWKFHAKLGKYEYEIDLRENTHFQKERNTLQILINM